MIFAENLIRYIFLEEEVKASGYIAGEIENQPESATLALDFMKFVALSVTGLIVIICVAFGPIKKYKNSIDKMKEAMECNDNVVDTMNLIIQE